MFLPTFPDLFNMYLIFGLLGDSATITGFIIPRILHIAFLVCVVAVAVTAIIFTRLGIRLLTSPRL